MRLQVTAVALLLPLLAGCFKPRQYVLANNKVYLLADAAWVTLVVYDEKLGEQVAYKYKLPPKTKVVLP